MLKIWRNNAIFGNFLYSYHHIVFIKRRVKYRSSLPYPVYFIFYFICIPSLYMLRYGHEVGVRRVSDRALQCKPAIDDHYGRAIIVRGGVRREISPAQVTHRASQRNERPNRCDAWANEFPSVSRIFVINGSTAVQASGRSESFCIG